MKLIIGLILLSLAVGGFAFYSNYATPTCEISVSSPTVQADQAFTVTWSSKNISDPVFYNQGALGGKYSVAANGTREITLPAHSVTDTFALGSGGPNGPDNPLCTVSVVVEK